MMASSHLYFRAISLLRLAPGPLRGTAFGALRSYFDRKHGFQGFGPGVHQFLPVTIYAFYIQYSSYTRYESANAPGEALGIFFCFAYRISFSSPFSAAGLSFCHGYTSAYSMDVYDTTGARS
jgi:hypothetical protein